MKSGNKFSRRDIVGLKVGQLMVLNFSHTDKKVSFWNCKCLCGNEKIYKYTLLKNNRVQSCGCLVKNYLHNLEGQIFNRLTILTLEGKNKYNSYMYEVLCYCGKKFRAEGNDVKSGRLKSCGCAKTEHMVKKANYKQSIINNLFLDYKIKAKQRQFSFDLTKEQFMVLIHLNCGYCNNGLSNIKFHHTNKNYFIFYNGIDRIDNDKGYELENCVTSCYDCNQAKHQMTFNKFSSWLDRINTAKNNKTGIWKTK